jgi:hypothetical protein
MTKNGNQHGIGGCGVLDGNQVHPSEQGYYIDAVDENTGKWKRIYVKTSFISMCGYAPSKIAMIEARRRASMKPRRRDGYNVRIGGERARPQHKRVLRC